MGRCNLCGNDYHRSFEVTMAGKTYTFDSFECAIHQLAPVCAHCGCKVIGHGIEVDNTIYCCNHCAGGDSDNPSGTDRTSPEPRVIV